LLAAAGAGFYLAHDDTLWVAIILAIVVVVDHGLHYLEEKHL
jgi:hypothetical protein